MRSSSALSFLNSSCSMPPAMKELRTLDFGLNSRHRLGRRITERSSVVLGAHGADTHPNLRAAGQTFDRRAGFGRALFERPVGRHVRVARVDVYLVALGPFDRFPNQVEAARIVALRSRQV